ncbi:MAG: MBL fold metallo-hydrolase [Oscillospiraceae bacterium]|nr:MBL fold metallo-hydrolase [Oscillospiraceae bacterium]
MKKLISILLCSIIIISGSSGCVDGFTVSKMISNTTGSDQQITIDFLNVGQGDCELVILPNNRTMLIDAGNRNDGDLIVDYLNSLKIKTLDYVICTHPHEDHIGGMRDIIENFDIGQLYLPQFSEDDTPTTRIYEDLLEAANDKKLSITNSVAGLSILEEQGLDIHMVAPKSTDYGDLNDYSAVVYLKFNNTVALFMGDAGKPSEEEIINNKYDVDADILKVGHHGSSTSSSKEFISAVSPETAIISCGINNSYNLPNDSTLVTLNNAGADIYRTDIIGTIEIKINSESYTVNKLPNINLNGGD